MPTSSRQSGTTTTTPDASPVVPGARAVPAQHQTGERTAPRVPTVAPPTAARITTVRPETAATIDRAATERAEAAAKAERAATERAAAHGEPTTPPPVAAGPRPRASLLATLGLITGVAAALLVLSGPLLGYGIALAALALVLSLGGISATGRRHVAGKTDALLGMVLALGAIVLGVLALTGSLSWLGTDTQPVNQVREWLDARFIDAL